MHSFVCVVCCRRQQRVVREAVFRSGHIPLWVSPVGYTFFAVLGTIFIPFIYKPGGWVGGWVPGFCGGWLTAHTLGSNNAATHLVTCKPVIVRSLQ